MTAEALDWPSVQQCFGAELVDAFVLHIVLILLGDGERLLDNVGSLIEFRGLG